MASEQTDLRIEKYIETPTLFTQANGNALVIRSDFLRLEKCSLLLHVLIPEKKKNEPPTHQPQYLIRHVGTSVEAGRDERGFMTYTLMDIFSVYFLTNRWHLTMSNSQGRWLYPFLEIRDRAKPGWHQFIIAWDKTKPSLTFHIHGRDGGNDSASAMQFWPERIDPTVCIGATPKAADQPSDTHLYIETQLAHLWIVPDYVNEGHAIALSHRQIIL